MPAEKHRWSCSQGAVGSARVIDYTLSPEELRWYGYPTEEGFFARLTESRPETPRVFGLDCEMVLTASGPALARVSLLALIAEGEVFWPSEGPQTRAWRPYVVYDALVNPPAPVTDYLTEQSGITARDLDGVTRTAEEARAELCSLVRESDILCGHDLRNDLCALQFVHPLLIDTMVLYPHQDGPPCKRSLESLCQEHLKRRIQVHAHSSVEDAGAALALVRLRVESRQGRLVWAPLPKDEQSHTEKPTRALLLKRMKLTEEQVSCVFLRGSRAVGYAGVRDDGLPSDWDFVVVTASSGAPQEDVHLSYGDLEAVLYDERSFLRLLRDCSIWALECIFAPRACILKEEIDFRALFARYYESTPRDVILARLRRSVSFASGRQWSRAKRTLEQKKDSHGCRKRIFIALRFLIYGIEVARTGRISDIRCANHLWEERLSREPGTSWQTLRLAYEPLYKELRQALHREAPRLPRYGGLRYQFQPARREHPSTQNRPSLHNPGSVRAPLRESDASLATVRLLRSSGDPEAALFTLQKTFHLHIRHHARFPNVVQLRYTPQSSPKDHPVVRECRGLILDAARRWEVLAFPFLRFFQLGEVEEALDWGSARVYEKLDGSLAILYWYEGSWRVASSRRPDATGLMGLRSEEGGLPFSTLFWDIWRKGGYRLPPPPEKGARFCYLFELTSRRHPIIVRYPEERLTLIGARSLEDHRERDPRAVADAHGWRAQEPLSLFDPRGLSPEEIARRLKEEAQALDASLQEGFVVCDARFRRVKVKAPDYLRMTWMFPLCPTRERLGRRHMLRVVLLGETEELLACCPEYRDEIEEVLAQYNALCADIQEAYRQIQHASEPAGFARLARRYPFSDVLFGMKKQRRGPREIMQDLPFKKIERWMPHRAP